MKICQHSSNNRSKFVQKSTKIGPKVLLESSGGHLGPKSKKSAFDPPSSPPSWEPSWSPKSIKIGPKSDPKCDHFLDRFGESFLKRFVPTWAHLDSQNPPKMRPSWPQNRSKLGCWFETCFLKVVVWIFIHFCSQHNMAEGTISSALSSNYELFCFLVVVMLGWFFIEIWLIFGGFWSRKSMKIPSKIDPKGDRKQDAS